MEAFKKARKESRDKYDRVGWRMIYVQLLADGSFGKLLKEIYQGKTTDVLLHLSTQNASS